MKEIRNPEDIAAVRKNARNRTDNTRRGILDLNRVSERLNLDETTGTDKFHKLFEKFPLEPDRIQNQNLNLDQMSRNERIIFFASEAQQADQFAFQRWLMWKLDYKEDFEAFSTFEISSQILAKQLLAKYSMTIDKYLEPGVDETMAHELANTHLKGIPAHVIQRYVADKGLRMKEFRDKVVSNARGEGKLTNWAPTGTKEVNGVNTGGYTPMIYRTSDKRVGKRIAGANMTVTKKGSPVAPGGPGVLSHVEYTMLQIQNFVDLNLIVLTPEYRLKFPIKNSLLNKMIKNYKSDLNKQNK